MRIISRLGVDERWIAVDCASLTHRKVHRGTERRVFLIVLLGFLQIIHICTRTCPHLCRDWPTSAAQTTAVICAGACGANMTAGRVPVQMWANQRQMWQGPAQMWRIRPRSGARSVHVRYTRGMGRAGRRWMEKSDEIYSVLLATDP